MKPRLLTATCATVLVVTLMGAAEAQREDPAADRQRAREAGWQLIEGVRSAREPEGVGTIRYDPGAPDGVRFADPPYVFLGNFFDTQSGQPLSMGTVSAISWYQGPATGKGYVNLVIVPSTGATQMMVTVMGVTTFATNTVTLATPVTVTPPFFVGVNAVVPGGEGPTSFTQVGFNSATTNGQGFHGSQRPFTVGAQFGRVPIPGQNISVRVSGNVAIPVELLEFDID